MIEKKYIINNVKANNIINITTQENKINDETNQNKNQIIIENASNNDEVIKIYDTAFVDIKKGKFLKKVKEIIIHDTSEADSPSDVHLIESK